MSKTGMVITIDGPSGVGKSTISRQVATALGFTYLDTGAMYRAVAYHFQQMKIDPENPREVAAALDDIQIELFPAREKDGDVRVCLNGDEIGEHIRTSEISMFASRVSALPVVRQKLTKLQQRLGKKGTIVAEGRDTGTVVFPSAAYKFYLDATPEERTRRRALQLREKGDNVDEEQLLKMTVTRDKNDSEREIAPLRKAEDAVYVDTTEISVSQVLEKILTIVRREV